MGLEKWKDLIGEEELKAYEKAGFGNRIGFGKHPALLNIDMTYILMDNRIYGLTKGQTSPTTRTGFWTKTSPEGVVETPMCPVELGIIFGASFVARGYSAQQNELQEILVRAIQHKGFSLVHVITPCVTFGKGSGFDYFNQFVKPLPTDHDPFDRRAALEATWEKKSIYTGRFYQTDRAEYLSQMQATGSARGREIDDTAPKIDVEALINRFS